MVVVDVAGSPVVVVVDVAGSPVVVVVPGKQSGCEGPPRCEQNVMVHSPSALPQYWGSMHTHGGGVVVVLVGPSLVVVLVGAGVVEVVAGQQGSVVVVLGPAVEVVGAAVVVVPRAQLSSTRFQRPA